METRSDNSLIFELADSVLRNWWTIVAGLCFGVAGSMLALERIPEKYQAESQIHTTPQQIPKEFVAPVVTEDMAHLLQILRGGVFDQASIEAVVDEVYGGFSDDPEQLERRIESIRRRVDVAALGRSGVFELRVTDGNPERAAKIVNLLTERFIELNSRIRQNQAGDTAEELQLLADEWRDKWKVAQSKLDAYLEQHPFQTYEFLEINRQSLNQLQNELSANRERQDELRREIRDLEIRVAAAEAASNGSTAVPEGASDPLAQQIKAVEAEIQQLLLRYTRAHPSVDSKQKQLEDLLERRRVWLANRPEPSRVPIVERTAEELELEDLRVSLTKSQNREQAIASEIRLIEQRIANTPQVQTRATELANDRDILKKNYEKYQRDLEVARGAQRLEERELGAQFKVVSFAEVPLKPIQPQPLKVYLVGIVAGCLLFIAPVPLHRLLHPLVLSESGMRSATRVPVLVAIPQLATAETRSIRVRRIVRNVVLAMVSSGLLATVVVSLTVQG